ncbi:MAG TPA: cupredoxin domain-containing protein [Nitrolancea sp.]|nr:cupredoxin domain-containing protein [Nitrolancea sp.]
MSEKEWSITVSGTEMTMGQGNVMIPAGNVTFVVKNDGTVTHEFEIQGNGVDQKLGDIAPGESATLKVDLKAGKYEVFCPIPGHKQFGIDGFVTAS